MSPCGYMGTLSGGGGGSLLFFFLRLNKFKECNVSSQATAWFKK